MDRPECFEKFCMLLMAKTVDESFAVTAKILGIDDDDIIKCTQFMQRLVCVTKVVVPLKISVDKTALEEVQAMQEAMAMEHCEPAADTDWHREG